MSVSVKPDELWGYFQANKEALKEKYLLVADDPEEDTEIYLTEEEGMPFFLVEIGGNYEAEVASTSKEIAEEYYASLLTLYITEYSDTSGDGEIFSKKELDRLDDIQEAAEQFLYVLIGASLSDVGIEEKDIDDIVYLVEEFLCENYRIPVYHPNIVEDEESGECFVAPYQFDWDDGE